ncbi:hypothetical protein [Candidatus Hamiltonella defensa]|uniref:hypothetical protein n=1 Tax=Candidatus Williamhamiltonella defendens TaxID=138072 RepID=UPI001581A6A7|nr:hypothetical protein [Candidatus Hamiltonella defensa]
MKEWEFLLMLNNIMKSNTNQFELSEKINNELFNSDPLSYLNFNKIIDEIAINNIKDIINNNDILEQEIIKSDGQGRPLKINIKSNSIIAESFNQESIINIKINKNDDLSHNSKIKIFDKKEQLKEIIKITENSKNSFKIYHETFNSKGILINKKEIEKNPDNRLEERNHIFEYSEEKLIKKIVTETSYNSSKQKISFFKKTKNLKSGQAEEIKEYYDNDFLLKKSKIKFFGNKKIKETELDCNLTTNSLKEPQKTEKKFDDLGRIIKEVISFYDSSTDKITSQKTIKIKFDDLGRVTEETTKMDKVLENKIKIKTKWDYVNRVIEIKKVYRQSKYITNIKTTKKYYDRRGLLIREEEKEIIKDHRDIESKKLINDLIKEYDHDSSVTRPTIAQEDNIKNVESTLVNENIEPAVNSFIDRSSVLGSFVLSSLCKEIKNFFTAPAEHAQANRIPQAHVLEKVDMLPQNIAGFSHAEKVTQSLENKKVIMPMVNDFTFPVN